MISQPNIHSLQDIKSQVIGSANSKIRTQSRLRMVWLADAGHVDVQRWYGALTKAGVDVTLLSLRSGGKKLPEAEQIPIAPWLRKLKYIAAVPYVRERINVIKPDVVVAYYITGYGTLAALSGYSPLVLSSAGSDILVSPKNPIMREMVKFNFSRANLVTGLAPHMADAARGLGVPDKDLFVVPLGIPVDNFARMRCQSPTTKDSARIICTRSLQARYNIDRLIRALPIIREKGIDARLTIAGDGPERGNLMTLAQELGVGKYVKFPGFVPNDQLPALLAQHNMYISLIESDGVSSSLIEVMSVGLLPIVPNNAANQYWIRNHQNGILLDDIDPNTVARAASKAIRNLALRERAWCDNLEEVRRRGDLYRNSEIYVDRLVRLVNNR